MTDFIDTYTIDLNAMTVKEYDNIDVTEMICENEGSFSQEGQYVIFDCAGLELSVNFDLEVYGNVSYDSGDYWTPPSTDVDVTDVEVAISDIYLNDYDLSLDKNSLDTLENIIKDLF